MLSFSLMSFFVSLFFLSLFLTSIFFHLYISLSCLSLFPCFFLIERRCLVVNTPVSYLEGPGFGFLPGGRLC
jgi:hypothetical protein